MSGESHTRRHARDPPTPPIPPTEVMARGPLDCQVPAALGAGHARARERLVNSLRVSCMAGGTTRECRPSALALTHACCTPIDLQSGGIRIALTLSRALAAAAPEREYLWHVGGQRNGVRGRGRKRIGVQTVWRQERRNGVGLAMAEQGGRTCGTRVAAFPTTRVRWPRVPSASQRGWREGAGGDHRESAGRRLSRSHTRASPPWLLIKRYPPRVYTIRGTDRHIARASRVLWARGRAAEWRERP